MHVLNYYMETCGACLVQRWQKFCVTVHEHNNKWELQLLVCAPGCFRAVPCETHKIKEYFREAYSARIERANQSSNQPRVKVIGQRQGKGVGGAVKPNFTDHGVCRWWRAVQRQKG